MVALASNLVTTLPVVAALNLVVASSVRRPKGGKIHWDMLDAPAKL